MKKIFFVVAVFLFTDAKSQIPNAGFEEWPSPTTMSPTGWTTATGSYGSVTLINPGHNGSNNAVSLNLNQLSYPSGFATIRAGSSGYPGFVIDYARPQSITGFVKGSLLRVTVKIYLQGSNTTSGVGFIGSGTKTISGGDWTQFTVPINYTTSGLGRTVTIEFENVGSSGNSVYVDDLSLNLNSVGINEISQDSIFCIFPNPTSNQINFQVDSKYVGISYSVYDNTGRTILTGKIDSVSTLLELGSLSKGIYMLSFGEDMKESFKIIKE